MVGIVSLGGNAIADGVGKVNRLLISSAGGIAELKVNLAEVDRCGTVLAAWVVPSSIFSSEPLAFSAYRSNVY